MKHSLYKWFLILALVMPLALTACGQDIEQVVQEAAEQIDEAIAEQATQVPEVVEEPTAVPAQEEAASDLPYDESIYGNIDELDVAGTVVTFWHQHTGARQEELLSIVDEFNATNPYGIIIDARNEGGYSDIYNKMIAGLTTGEVPGLTVAYQNQAAAYMVAEGLVDLDPYINHPEYGLTSDELGDFFQAFIDGDRLPQFGNKPYGFPPNRSMEMLYYNAEWLAEMYDAGAISFEGPPQNWEQFAEATCAAVDNPFSKNEDPSRSIGYQIRTDASNYAALVFALGGDIYDYDNNQFTLDTPEAQEALSFMQALLDQGCVARIAERFGDQTDFGNGQNLFTMGSSSGLPFYRAAVDEGATGGFDWSVAAIPHTTPDPVMNIYGASVSIPRTDPVTQLAAWLFTRYYTSPDVQAGWALASNYFPVRASVADNLESYFAENPTYETAFNLLPFGKREAPVAGYDNVRDVMTGAFEEILAGGNVATVLANAEREANRILAEAAPDGMPPAPEPVVEEEAAGMDYDTAVYGNIDEIDVAGTVVTFWHQHTGARQEELLAIVDEFNATNPYGIIIDARNEGGYSDIYNKMIAGLTTGEVPGLTVAYQNQAAAYMVADGLIDLDPYINHPEYGLTADELGDFFQAFIDGDRLPQFGNKPYGFPPNRSMEMLYYNAEWLNEMFEAGAISFEGPPQTWEQFAEATCAAVDNPFSKNEDPSRSIGYQVRTDASNYAALVFGLGGDIYDYDNNQFTLDTPEAQEALSFMQALLDQGCAARIAERFGDQTDFGNGQNLFTMGSSSGLPFYRAAVDEGATGGFDWSVAAIPHTTPDPVMNIYGASVSIPRTDPVTQLAAWLFTRYYTSPDVQAGWALASNYFPVRASVADNLESYFAENPTYETAFNLLPFGKREAPVAGYDNVRDVMTGAFEEILAGGDVATILAAAEVEANRILAEAAP